MVYLSDRQPAQERDREYVQVLEHRQGTGRKGLRGLVRQERRRQLRRQGLSAGNAV